MERNSCRAPWINTLDGRFSVELPFRKVQAEITLDILNMINLFDPKGGQFQYTSFNDILVGHADGAQRRAHRLQPVGPSPARSFQRFIRSDLRSRWQMQLGGE